MSFNLEWEDESLLGKRKPPKQQCLKEFQILDGGQNFEDFVIYVAKQSRAILGTEEHFFAKQVENDSIWILPFIWTVIGAWWILKKVIKVVEKGDV